MTGSRLEVGQWRTFGQDLCDTAEQIFDEQGAPDRRPPARLRHGVTYAHDQADVIYISIERVVTRADPKVVCVAWPRPRWRIDLLRPWPADRSLAADMAFARALLEDAALLWNGIVTRAQSGTLVERVPGLEPSDVTVGDLTPIDPSGAIAGWRFTLDIDQMFAAN